MAVEALGPVSISEKTSFHKISSSLEAARVVSRIVRSLWNLTGTSAALLPMCLSNFKAIRRFKVQFSWLRDFTRSYEKTSFRILRRGPGSLRRRQWFWYAGWASPCLLWFLKFHLPTPSRCWMLIINAITYVCLLKEIYCDNGLTNNCTAFEWRLSYLGLDKRDRFRGPFY